MTAAGGLCPYGACHTELNVWTDGAYSLQQGNSALKRGAIDQARLAPLRKAIDQADFAEIKSRPFTGQCPTAYDGVEITYIFNTPHGIETIPSCQFAIDADQPLFQLADGLWQEIFQLP